MPAHYRQLLCKAVHEMTISGNVLMCWQCALWHQIQQLSAEGSTGSSNQSNHVHTCGSLGTALSLRSKCHDNAAQNGKSLKRSIGLRVIARSACSYICGGLGRAPASSAGTAAPSANRQLSRTLCLLLHVCLPQQGSLVSCQLQSTAAPRANWQLNAYACGCLRP